MSNIKRFNIKNMKLLIDMLLSMMDNINFIINLLHQITKNVMIYHNNLYRKNDNLIENIINIIEYLWKEIIYNIKNASYERIHFYIVNESYHIESTIDVITVDLEKTNYIYYDNFTYKLIVKNIGITGKDTIILIYIDEDNNNLEYHIKPFHEDYLNLYFNNGIYFNIMKGKYLYPGLIIKLNIICNKTIIFKYKNEKIKLQIHKIISSKVILNIKNINSILIDIEKIIKRISNYYDYIYSIYLYTIYINNTTTNTTILQNIQTIFNIITSRLVIDCGNCGCKTQKQSLIEET